jgi:hypothetical protein
MIERRKEARFRLSVPVKVSGIDDNGEPFAIEVRASSLSRSGALLTGLEVELRCGDMLVLDYEGCRAHFRIVWFLNMGTRLGAEVAIHKSNREPCPWADLLPAESALASATSRIQ